ncbi:endonuclease/exonuclease/phosphatase (EEP) superfamily protein YafD [Saccharothrix tamanrassetensis]|uniref:Endonuclease/exonuclease/phosphatase (EEP) superfamily protein YafD n=1 Tax=Saccharothrix tamanrassetensis TaxID=1051531 RepID=A0A841CH86_9PSEU|nr:endonuclease/exonuclease/phosphatase family protein [Saccharothrix tamanrassetensis]MBB5956669.1 endonuclease/exonuclease/phosphatase (EEP) superfamily protein YafD [Saccharothrix tamanrassetensis]
MADIEERRPRSKAATFLLVIATTAFVVAAALRLLGIDGTRHMVATTALVPYVTAVGVLLGAIALLLRRWLVGTVTLLVALVLVAAVAPRAFPDSRPIGVGQQVRVMAANLLVGRAEAEAVVEAVRAHEVDVLALQELTPAMVRDFERAGLDEVLPHRVFLAEPGASGSGIASRYPLTARDLAAPSTLRQAGALVDLPGEDLEVVSVHPLPPVVPDGPETWQRDMAGLPQRDLNGPFRVLAGDFNATLDHVGLRRLLNQGYVDAADQVGAGLDPTWPSGAVWPPPVVIDHVLVDNRCPVDTFQVIDIPGSDHRAIVTQFVVPAP